jgi:hypothetical protein
MHGRKTAAPARVHAGHAGRPSRLRWARRTALCEGDVTTTLPWSTTTMSRHPYTGTARYDAWQRKKETPLRPRRHRPFQFRDSIFEITKLQKVSTYSKISKNKSCRGVIDLQLSQRATYVLINGFVWKTCWTCWNSQLRVTIHSAFKSKLSELSLKISMSANYEKCVPGNNEQLSYWLILNFYSEIWRTLKKTKSAF